jgi:glucosylglycerate phosphorylase
MTLDQILKELYPNDNERVFQQILSLISKRKTASKSRSLDQTDVMLITYGDSLLHEGENPLRTLKRFLDHHTGDLITNVHLLPMFPFTSDDGFSVVDYEKVNPSLGSWDDIDALAKGRGLMFDAVINHMSVSSAWFKGYLKGHQTYQDFFIECDPSQDYSEIVRPRALPLFYPFQTHQGIKHIWATFSSDQVDLNYRNPNVLLVMLDILITYAQKGARFLRLDAVGFLWKEINTASIHLNETHLLIRLIRQVLDKTVPGTILITETNVPHQENISYFGDGHNEAHLVYQFPLPPLTLHAFVSRSAYHLMTWAQSLEETSLTEETTYFNFLASHDGIGMRPVEGILSEDERQKLIDHVSVNGGKISYKNNKDGSMTPYELNISFLDAISFPHDSKEYLVMKMMASQVILLSMIGIPGIYIHSILGSRNDDQGFNDSRINRRINREKLKFDLLIHELNDQESIRHHIFTSYLELLEIRRQIPALSPHASQKVVFLDDRVFSLERHDSRFNQRLVVVVNVSDFLISLDTIYTGTDLISKTHISKSITLSPYQYCWIELDQEKRHI